VDGFLFALAAEAKAPPTIRYYRDNLRRFVWFIRYKNWPDDPCQIDQWRIREFLAYASSAPNRWGRTGNGSENCRGPSKSAGWRYYRTLRALYRWAVADGILKPEINPMLNIKVKPPKEQPVEPYTLAELKALIGICDHDIANHGLFTGLRNKAMILLFLDSGMRCRELADLKLSQVSLELGRAAVTGKGGYQRVVPFSSKTKKAIWRYMLVRDKRAKPEAGEWLWLTEEGRRLSWDGLKIAFERVKDRAGIKTPGAIHKLRHTFALNALRGLKDPTLLQLLLGHKSLEMTRRYTQGLKIEEALTAMEKASPVERLGLG
jgi:site-specific recombinase XerD